MSQLQIDIELPTGKKYRQPRGLFINNQFVESIDKKTLDTVDPSTGKIICSVYEGNEKDVDVAVKCARDCFENVWNDISGTDRGKLMYKFAELLEEHKDLLSDIESYDSGKPRYTNAIFDIEYTVNVFRYYAGYCDKTHGRTIPVGNEKFAYYEKIPYGVVGHIVPWNYPICMAGWKIAPALAAGNVIIMKSAENTPLSILKMAELFVEAGFPPGVFNVVSGHGPVAGAALASHMDVDKISFTGSTKVGQIVQQLASSNLKAVTMECGGKSPLLICDDADLDEAAKWAAFGIMYNMGQICIGTSRIYVQENVYDKFLPKLKKRVEEVFKPGDPFGKETNIGPQVSKIQQMRILSFIDSGKKAGAKIILGGKAPSGFPEESCYIEPTIFTNVTQDMEIVQEEIFGPVVTVSKFKTDEEGIFLANDTKYGLGASIFTESYKRAHNFAKKVQSGQIWVNSTNASDFRVPFGGVKITYKKEPGYSSKVIDLEVLFDFFLTSFIFLVDSISANVGFETSFF
ncbi:hypothetical protein PACTADRAFT_83895 [Pachysolen tannophilus NRRL Y-2460]|uniref:Aldehyde dehydrogenase domain-containing protein n=1 Tax=Pachysolen tannophilus NRRL Y-2460 TaxID=669874 RepID=A0A1E4TXR8_PACTA|nr:hypothetical protein PACTADRAFT_83895 [Pachysolen tannophilus NRRL Y-2460]